MFNLLSLLDSTPWCWGQSARWNKEHTFKMEYRLQEISMRQLYKSRIYSKSGTLCKGIKSKNVGYKIKR